MRTHLLDVSVLFALMWPAHEHHSAAQAWLQRPASKPWATNPLTQLGLLRMLTNAALTQGAVSAAAALDILDVATQQEGHEFWALAAPVGPAFASIVPLVRGYRQWTDAFLFRSAVECEGIFVTFDAGIRELTTRESAGNLLVLKQR